MRNARSRLSLTLAVLAALLAAACQSPDPIAKEKERTLTPDERYLVEYYLRIAEARQNLHDIPAAAGDASLAVEIDTARVSRTIRALERDPERWLAVYARINELRYRAGARDST